MRNTIHCVFLLLVFSASISCSFTQNEFILSSSDQKAGIVLLSQESEAVQLAVEDLIGDVEKITGETLEIFGSLEECPANCAVVGSVDNVEATNLLNQIDSPIVENLQGKWESYRVVNRSTEKGQILVFAGSDERGTMFAIYDFLENYLEVDPMHFWSDREPEKRDRLSWSNVEIIQDEPSFKYRGFFINDEDLLTHWKESEGRRYLEYYYYHQVASAEVLKEVYEAALRLRYNLIIPASFIDIKNPPEKKLIDEAVKRGMFVSMHHIEPLGVGGYKYANYWKKRGEDPKFSYYSEPDKLIQVWRDYAEDWAQYGDQVIWQLGLRGIADQPMWAADPGVPQSDADRGKIISEAMEVQKDIVLDVADRENPVMTTTLWMEGASLHNEGHLEFPENVHVIFSDNSPGWKWQEDFYNVEKSRQRNYGIYYHHQLWGNGPHLVQGLSPKKTYSLYKEAVERNSHWYAINNVSNVRPFILGITATGKMMYNFDDFDPEVFFEEWCEENFGNGSGEAKRAYSVFFDSYVVDEPGVIRDGDRAGTPMLLDGLTLSRIKSYLRSLNNKIEKLGSHPLRGDEKSTFEYYLKKLGEQKQSLENSIDIAGQAEKKMNQEDRRFFRQNLISHQKIMYGLTTWLETVIHAHYAMEAGNIEQVADELLKAEKSIKKIREGQMINTQGEKWKWWYWGDRKMDLNAGQELWKSVLIKAQRNIEVR